LVEVRLRVVHVIGSLAEVPICPRQVPSETITVRRLAELI
jgi:hypothetical protein